MISTRFLSAEEYPRFGTWLKTLSAEDRNLYFGMVVSDDYIDQLIARITADTTQHHFLISYNCTDWLGVLHIARVSDDSIEFGISVNAEYRNFGIGSDLLKEGIVWSRNRGYQRLYLHCVAWNRAMAHLADKHGLTTVQHETELDVSAHLPPPSWYSLQQETADVHRRMFYLWLNRAFFPFQEAVG